MSSKEYKFRSSWTADYGMLKEDNRAKCILCSQRLDCTLYSVKRHYENKHKDLQNKTEDERRTIIAEIFIKKNIKMPSTATHKKISLNDKFETNGWTKKYGMIYNGAKALCVMCSGTVACSTFNIKRHYMTAHKELLNKTEDEQIEFIAKAVAKRKSDLKDKIFDSKKRNIVNTKTAAFSISQLIASYGKGCCDGDFIKQLWFDSAPYLFKDFNNVEEILKRIHSLPKINPRIMVLDMANNITLQQNAEMQSSPFYSLCIDESVDKIGLISLAIVVRYIVKDDIKEECISLCSLPAKPGGSDISYVVTTALRKRRLDLSKVVSITTDGSRKMLHETNGFMALFQQLVGFSNTILGFHSIMHPKVLCENVGSVLEDIMGIITETVHLIPARDPDRMAFTALMSEVNTVYNNLLMYNDVRYFCRGQILQNFVDCLTHVMSFLYKEKLVERHDQLKYSFEGQSRIMFFTDLCKYIYMINEKFQDNCKHILDMIQLIKEIDVEFKKFELDIICNAYQYFPNVKNIFFGTQWKQEQSVIEELTKEFTSILQNINEQSILRFQEILQLEQTLSFLIYPDTISVVKLELDSFKWLNVQNFQLELVEFQNIPVWKQKFVDMRKNWQNQKSMSLSSISTLNINTQILETWNMIPESFLWLKKLALAILTIFPSTKTCEALFDNISLLKNSTNQIICNEYSEACLLLKVSEYQPNLIYLAEQLAEPMPIVEKPTAIENTNDGEN